VVTRTGDPAGLECFELRPNRSLSGGQLRAAYGAVAGTCLAVAGGFAALGFWPVLPFAGLEAVALGAALAISARSARVRETVAVASEVVAVVKQRRHTVRNWRFPRGWVRARLVRPAHAWYPSRLVIGCHGREVTVGGFLAEEERQALARELARACRPRTWRDQRP